MGHILAEPEACLVDNNFQTKNIFLVCPTKKIFNIFPRYIACNITAIDYWKKYFTTITSPILYLILYPFIHSKHLKICYNDIRPFLYGPPKNIAPIFILKNNHLENGKKILSSLGLPKDAWYVCFSCRNNDYYPEHKNLFNIRNSNVEKLLPSLQEIEKSIPRIKEPLRVVGDSSIGCKKHNEGYNRSK